jgi:quercetin dioxygenase-like cupin family protein
MAVERAEPGEVIDVRPLGPRLPDEITKTLIKTDRLEVLRLVVPAGKEIPAHQVSGEITVQCLEGRVAFRAGEATRELEAGHMLYLRGNEPHSVRGIEDGSLLITILLGS